MNDHLTADTFELDLTGMSHGGSAIGRHQGRAIFVPYGVPGDRVRVRIVQDKGRFALAELIQVIQPAASRIEPRCQHFGVGRCGGCQFQSIDYAKQLELKQQTVADQLARLGGIADALVHPTLPSPQPWHYRSHVTFHVTPRGQLGFVSTDGRTILPIDQCHIMSEPLASEFQSLRAHTFPPAARLRLQAGSSGQPVLFDMGSTHDDVAEALPSRPHHRPSPALPAAAPVHYTLHGRAFRCSPGSFFQVNLPQAAALVQLALDRLALSPTQRVLDLYAGVGLFTAFIAPRVQHVDAVELFAPAVADARHNLSDYANITFHIGKIESILPRLTHPIDSALVDPPRAGMDAPALNALIHLNPRQIVYVSCDPATLARDARRLREAGYHLRDVQPVDMFPQTYHIESVAHFLRPQG